MGIKSWLAKEEAATSEDEFLAPFVKFALWTLAGIVVAATVTGLVESFDGLYNWFSTHGFTGWKADYAPLMVDSFSVIGEIALFAAISRRWAGRRRFLPWVSTIVGITASVAANVGDVASHSITWMLTAAVAPLAGAFGIVIGLGVLKQVAKDVVAKARARKDVIEISRADLADQLFKDNQELMRQLTEARSASVLDISPEPEVPNRDRELRGMDVLIPPRSPAEPVQAPIGSLVQPPTGPQAVVPGVSRTEARSRLAPDPRLIHQTDSFPAVA